MTTGILHQSDLMHTTSPNGGPRFRPFASSVHKVTKGRYITSNDPRGYIPVYEYPLNGQWIMMDIDDGYILWTGIWKALGNSKADIVKMIDSQPDLASVIRRVRGGYLKIQGTWMPYEVALRLSRRVAWSIREDLIPLFGPTFPSTCLSPDQPGYGQVVASSSGRRRRRTAAQINSNTNSAKTSPKLSTPSSTTTPGQHEGGWNISHPTSSQSHHDSHFPPPDDPSIYHRRASIAGPVASGSRYSHSQTSTPVLYNVSSHPEMFSGSPSVHRDHHHHHHHHQSRYTPYPDSIRRASLPGLSTSSTKEDPPAASDTADRNTLIKLPPLRIPDYRPSSASFSLPPISVLDDGCAARPVDSAAVVLERLKASDHAEWTPELESTRLPSLSYGLPQLHYTRQSDNSSPPQSHLNRSSPSVHPRQFDSRDYYHYSHQAYNNRLPLRCPSAQSHSDDGHSTCDASPISPATPHSAYDSVPESVASFPHPPAFIRKSPILEPSADIMERADSMYLQ